MKEAYVALKTLGKAGRKGVRPRTAGPIRSTLAKKSYSDETEVSIKHPNSRSFSAAFGGEQVPFNMISFRPVKGNNERAAPGLMYLQVVDCKFDAMTGKEQLTVVGIPDPFDPGPISPITDLPARARAQARAEFKHSKLPHIVEKN